MKKEITKKWENDRKIRQVKVYYPEDLSKEVLRCKKGELMVLKYGMGQTKFLFIRYN